METKEILNYLSTIVIPILICFITYILDKRKSISINQLSIKQEKYKHFFIID